MTANEDASWSADLARALSRARWIILAPALAGLALFLALGGWQGEPGLAAFLALALGLNGAAVAAWVLRLGLDSGFLPSLARARGLEHEPVASTYRLLPEGVLPEGHTRMMRNLVTGRIADRSWQAGFLEIGRKQRNKGNTISIFRGQLVQVEAPPGAPDVILLPANRRPAAMSGGIGTLNWPQRAEFTWQSRRWQVFSPQDVGPEDLQHLQVMMDTLPPLPRAVVLRAVVRANGWQHLVFANRNDLFRMGSLPTLWQPAEQVAERVFGNLTWAELVARAMVTQTD